MPVVNLESDGLDIAVLLWREDGAEAMSIGHTFAGDVTAGQSDREGRRPAADGLALQIGFGLIVADAEAQAFRQLLATLAAGWVGVPLWIDARHGDEWAERIYEAGRLFDLTDNLIVRADSVLDDAHLYAPLVVGHLRVLPELPAEAGRAVRFRFTVVEDSPVEFEIGIAAAGVAGAWPESVVPNWEDGAVVQKPKNGLVFGQIGQGREATIDNTESVFRWGVAAPFTLSDAEQIRALLAFFVACEGMRKKFTSPLWFTPGVASAEAPHTTHARFAAEVLTLDYECASVATATVEVVQVPWEIAGVEGEEPEQPPRAFLYRFVYALPAPIVYRFTNWPRALVRAGDGTYEPAPMLHREITDALDIRSNRTTLDSFHFAGNPLTLFQPNRIEAPLLLTIFEAESWPIDPDTAVAIFSGEVKRPKRTSRKIEAPVVFLAGFLEREFPRVRVGAACNTTLFSRLCGLVRADYEQAGTFTSAAGCVLTIATAAADAANTFALGTIEIGAGADWEMRQILASEPVMGGQLLTVDWPVRQAAAGQAVTFVRGCDRTGATCRSLGAPGSWKDRFRGHEHIPQDNLSLPTMALPSAPGKK